MRFVAGWGAVAEILSECAEEVLLAGATWQTGMGADEAEKQTGRDAGEALRRDEAKRKSVRKMTKSLYCVVWMPSFIKRRLNNYDNSCI